MIEKDRDQYFRDLLTQFLECIRDIEKYFQEMCMEATTRLNLPNRIELIRDTAGAVETAVEWEKAVQAALKNERPALSPPLASATGDIIGIGKALDFPKGWSEHYKNWQEAVLAAQALARTIETFIRQARLRELGKKN